MRAHTQNHYFFIFPFILLTRQQDRLVPRRRSTLSRWVGGACVGSAHSLFQTWHRVPMLLHRWWPRPSDRCTGSSSLVNQRWPVARMTQADCIASSNKGGGWGGGGDVERQKPLGTTAKGTDLEIILTSQLDPRTFDSSLWTSKGEQQLWLLRIKGSSFLFFFGRYQNYMFSSQMQVERLQRMTKQITK